MEQAARFESQVNQSLGQAQQSLGQAQRFLGLGDTVKAGQAEKDGLQNLGFAKQGLKRIEVLAGTLVDEEERKCRIKFDTARKRVEAIVAKYEALRNDLQRKSLFGTREAGRQGTEASFGSQTSAFDQAENEELLSQTMASLERSNNYLDDSQRVLTQTEEIGVNVLSNLDEQRQGILNATHKVNQTNSTIVEAQKALTRMARRACYNKLVLWVIIVLLLVVIGLVSYFKFVRH